jgi:hypothetical protein
MILSHSFILLVCSTPCGIDDRITSEITAVQISRRAFDALSLDYLVGLCAKAGMAVKVRTAA